MRHIHLKIGGVIKPQPTKPVKKRSPGRPNDRTSPTTDAGRSVVFQVVEIEPGNWALKKGSVIAKSGM